MKQDHSFRFFLKFLLVITFTFFALPAHAAPLNFISATPIDLTSPSTTLTIATGSMADSLAVNATSVVVGLSYSTGGNLTIFSPDYDLTVATTSAGGASTFTCASSVTTLVISQTSGATTYTVTPASTACTVTHSSTSPSSPPPVAVGGSGYSPPSFVINEGASPTASPTVTLSFATPPDVASFAITTGYGSESSTATSSYASTMPLNLCSGLSSCPVGTYLVSVNFLDPNGAFLASSSQSIDYTGTSATPSPTATSSVPSTIASSTITTSGATTAQLETLLTTLETELQTLLKEAAAKGIVIQGIPASVTSSSRYVFLRNLTHWDRGTDVNELQRYLVSQDSGPTAEALARHGTTDTFGPLTSSALKEFQKKVGIVPDSGYFGPITRAYIKAHGQ